MDKQGMHKLREKMCKELDALAARPNLNMGELELVHKITDTIKNLDKISMLEDSGYSETRGRGRSRSSYGYDDSSYDGYMSDDGYSDRARHYVRGHYSNHSKKGLIDYMEELIDETNSEHERMTLQRCLSQLKNV